MQASVRGPDSCSVVSVVLARFWSYLSARPDAERKRQLNPNVACNMKFR